MGELTLKKQNLQTLKQLHPTSFSLKKWSDTAKEVKVLVKSVPRDTPESPTRLPLKVSPSLPSEDWPEEVVLREFPLSSMMIPELSSRVSLKLLSETLPLTLSTPRERPSLLWTSSTLLRDKAEPSTVSVHELSKLDL